MPKKSQVKLRRERFAKEYVRLEFNGTKAAIAAGFSKKTARAQASRLLLNVDVQKYIQREAARLNAKIEIDQEELLKGALASALLDPREILEFSGESFTFKDMSKLPVEIARTIESVQKSEDGLKIKFESRAAARDFIAKVKGWYKDQPFTGGAKLVFLNMGPKDGE